MVAAAPSATLSLFPETPPELAPEAVALADLPADAALLGPPPGAALVASIRRCGVLQPVLLLRSAAGRLLVADGRRRVKAARAAALATIPAQVAPDEGSLHALLSLLTHGTRRDNPAAELDAIERLLEAGASEQAIARETGLQRATIGRRLRLHRLEPGLRDAYRQGRLTTSVAEAAARLPTPAQARLAAQLAEQGTLREPDVAAERRVRQEAAVAALPLALLAGEETGAPAPAGAEPAAHAPPEPAPAGVAPQLLQLLTWALRQYAAEQVQEVVPQEQGGLLVRLRDGGVCTVLVTAAAAGEPA